MNPEETQAPQGTDMGTSETAVTGQPDMSDDDVAALLGFTTTLSEQMMNPPQEQMAGDAENPQDTTSEPSGEPAAEPIPGSSPEVEQKNDKVLSEIQGLRDELKIIVAPKSVEQEVADIRKEIQALKNEPNREDTSTGE